MITQAVQQRYDWTWDDAERTKVFVGLPGHARLDASQQESIGPGHDGLDHPAQKVIASAAETLVQEIVHHPGLLPHLDRRGPRPADAVRPRSPG